MDIKVIVATHKRYWMPKDEMYIPIQVGAEGKESLGYIPDNTGVNISNKNQNYCELTGLYWAWKNLQADYIGLAHYRRHFSNGNMWTEKKRRVISKKELEKKIGEFNILLPKPRHYWIETNYSQYAHAHHAVDLDTTRDIIQNRYPDYLHAFDLIMKQTKGHRFNMFVMEKHVLDKYCEWLFDILFTLESKLDISKYSKNDSRVFGFISERLLDVWIQTNRYKYVEVPYVFLDKQNWFAKGYHFIVRKIRKGC